MKAQRNVYRSFIRRVKSLLTSPHVCASMKHSAVCVFCLSQRVQKQPEGAILGGSEGPGPYRDEHDSGASRFRDLLARAKKVDPTVEERLNLRPQPYAPTPQSDAQPQPRRPLPPRPKNPPNYDNLDEWDRIGSPALPDLPLRNEMPGLQIPGEMGNVNPRGVHTLLFCFGISRV